MRSTCAVTASIRYGESGLSRELWKLEHSSWRRRSSSSVCRILVRCLVAISNSNRGSDPGTGGARPDRNRGPAHSAQRPGRTSFVMQCGGRRQQVRPARRRSGSVSRTAAKLGVNFVYEPSCRRFFWKPVFGNFAFPDGDPPDHDRGVLAGDAAGGVKSRSCPVETRSSACAHAELLMTRPRESNCPSSTRSAGMCQVTSEVPHLGGSPTPLPARHASFDERAGQDVQKAAPGDAGRR